MRIELGDHQLYQGWGKDVLPLLPADSVDSIVTDPPYGLSKEPNMTEVLTHWLKGDDYAATGNGFMGKSWDSFVPGPATWREIFRVLKPGGYALVFAGSRTVDLMGVSLRLAGFEIRDQIQWVYGSGFPKSLDVSKAIDKAAGAEREVVGPSTRHAGKTQADSTIGDLARFSSAGDFITAPATPEAQQWQGWGTALKPAHEPIIVCRKPLGCATVAANVLMYGTGGLNIDGCRVAPTGERLGGGDENGKASKPEGWARPWMDDSEHVASHNAKIKANVERATELGRFPANLIHDGSDEVLAAFPDAAGQQGDLSSHANCRQSPNGIFGGMRPALDHPARIEIDKSAARFFYAAKASKSDRGEGNNHPTVKPQALMRYLVRLVTPPGGTVLDSFAGSGSTGVAAHAEGFRSILVEQCPDNFNTCCGRVAMAVMTETP